MYVVLPALVVPSQATAKNAVAVLISYFSWFGVAADLSLEPDIGAPGGSIAQAGLRGARLKACCARTTARLAPSAVGSTRELDEPEVRGFSDGRREDRIVRHW